MKTLILTIVTLLSWERSMEAGRVLRKTNVRLKTPDASVNRERVHSWILILGLSVMGAVQSNILLSVGDRYMLSLSFNGACLLLNATSCYLYKLDTAQSWKLRYIWANTLAAAVTIVLSLAWRQYV